MFLAGNAACGVMAIGAKPGETKWNSKILCTQQQTPIVHDGFLYGVGGMDPENYGKSPNVLRCIEWSTGTQRWENQTIGFGTLIRVGSTLLVLNRAGELIAIQATPEAYRELGRAKVLPNRTITGPSFAGGCVFVRDSAGTVVCLRFAKV